MIFHPPKLSVPVIFLLLTACGAEDLYTLPIEKYTIPQNGMYPSMPVKTTFWAIRRSLFNVEDVTRGEIIVFRQQVNKKSYNFVWRVIGLPGDGIRTAGTSVYINGEKLPHTKKMEHNGQLIFSEKTTDHEYLVAYDKQPGPSLKYDINTVVPDNHFFVLGDNRNNAGDSRYRGFVSFDSVVAKKI